MALQGAAPFGPEIEQYRLGGFEYVALERGVRCMDDQWIAHGLRASNGIGPWVMPDGIRRIGIFGSVFGLALGALRWLGEKTRATGTIKGLDCVIKDWFHQRRNRAVYGMLL